MERTAQLSRPQSFIFHMGLREEEEEEEDKKMACKIANTRTKRNKTRNREPQTARDREEAPYDPYAKEFQYQRYYHGGPIKENNVSNVRKNRGCETIVGQLYQQRK